MLREGFDVEGISASWSNEIQNHREVSLESNSISQVTKNVHPNGDFESRVSLGALSAYEDIIQDARRASLPNGREKSRHAVETKSLSTQEFLASQMEVMERLKAQEEQSHDGKVSKSTASGSLFGQEEDRIGVIEENGRISEQIGPVQLNMGGIQVDAEDMLKQLKDQGMERTPERDPHTPASPEAKSQNEALASFFAGLMKRGGSNSPRATNH